MSGHPQRRVRAGLRWGWIACLGLCLVMPAAEALAQELVRMGSLNGGITFGFLRNHTEISSQRANPRKFGLKRFEETLQLRGSLAVVDPSFLRFDFGSTVGWFQDNSFLSQQFLGGETVPFLEEESQPGGGRPATAFLHRLQVGFRAVMGP